MMKAVLRLVAAAVVCAAALCIAPAAHAQGTMGLPDCLGKPAIKPAAVTFACADGNFLAQSIQWTGWGQSFAAGLATFESNDCTPYCAAGHFHQYKGVIVASGKQKCPDGSLAYASVSYAFFGKSPFPVDAPGTQSFTQSFPCGHR